MADEQGPRVEAVPPAPLGSKVEEIVVLVRMRDGDTFGVVLSGDYVDMTMQREPPSPNFKGRQLVRLEGRDSRRVRVTDHGWRIARRVVD